MPNVERLKLIQGVIERMARNSFTLKGWTVAVVAALLGLASADSNRAFALIAVYVVVAFAALDAYYLALERAYRNLYDTASAEATDDAWALKVDPVGVVGVLAALNSPSVWLLHGVALVVSIAVALTA